MFNMNYYKSKLRNDIGELTDNYVDVIENFLKENGLDGEVKMKESPFLEGELKVEYYRGSVDSYDLLDSHHYYNELIPVVSFYIQDEYADGRMGLSRKYAFDDHNLEELATKFESIKSLKIDSEEELEF